MKQIKTVLIGMFLFLSVTSVNAADIFGETITLDTSPVITMAGIVVSAIASIWAVKKVISLGNKS